MKIANLILLSSIVFIVSCNSPRYIYSPAPPNNPYFKEKGQSKLAAYYSSGGDDNSKKGSSNYGVDVQGAYAIGDNWALTASWFNRKERDVFSYDRYNFFDSSVINYKRNILDAGAGFFLPLNKRKTVSCNLFGGLGFGKFSFTDNGRDKQGADYSRTYSSNITKWYLQSSLNALPGKYFRAGFVFRFSFVHYHNIATSYTQQELDYFSLDRIKKKTVYFFEPTFNMQLGIPKCDWIKLDASVTFSSDPYEEANIEARSLNASIGLCFDLSALKK